MNSWWHWIWLITLKAIGSSGGMRGPLISGTVFAYPSREASACGTTTLRLATGAIDLTPSSSHWLVENIDESGANWCGIRLGAGSTCCGTTSGKKNGDDGIDGSLIQYALVEGDAARFNNWQRAD